MWRRPYSFWVIGWGMNAPRHSGPPGWPPPTPWPMWKMPSGTPEHITLIFFFLQRFLGGSALRGGRLCGHLYSCVMIHVKLNFDAHDEDLCSHVYS